LRLPTVTGFCQHLDQMLTQTSSHLQRKQQTFIISANKAEVT